MGKLIDLFEVGRAKYNKDVQKYNALQEAYIDLINKKTSVRTKAYKSLLNKEIDRECKNLRNEMTKLEHLKLVLTKEPS